MGSTPNHPDEATAVSAEEIDSSSRLPVLVLFGSAILWLVLALVFGLISSIKMHAPGFISTCPWMSYGHVRAAYFDLLIYGFASQAGIGFGLWSLARLGRTQLSLAGLATAGALVWNLGVLIGLAQVLAGQSTGFAWMEFPRQAASLLVGGFFALTVSAFYTLKSRNQTELYVSQWFVAGALFVFPWLMTVAYAFCVVEPLRGVTQFIVASWFANGLLYLWLIPLGLAAAYYLLPKVSGSPLHSNQSAALGFWVLFVFGGWGATQLQGAPVPRWIGNAAVAGKIMMIVAAAGYASNWLLSDRSKKKGPAAAAYLGFASFALTTGVLLDVLGVLKPLARRVALTPYSAGVSQWLLLGFVTMVLLGAIQYVTPRVLGSEVGSFSKSRGPFVLFVLGILLVAIGSIVGGFSFGGALNDPSVLFTAASKGLVPFLGISSLGLTLALLGQILFAFQFLSTLHQATAAARSAFFTWCCSDSSATAGKARARA